MQVLIVDDDLALADVLSFTMRRAGYEVCLAHDGLAALERWKTASPDLILLDLNLPRLDGLSVCKQIRTVDDTPIIMLTVRGEDEDVVTGLESGADDYVVKPFSPRQVVARVEAVLRRANRGPVSSVPIEAGDLTLDLTRHQLLCGEEVLVQLTRLECRLLEALMHNPGQVVLADQLIDYVWGSAGADRSMLKQLVYRLRQKIEADPSNPLMLTTVSGIGYAFYS